MNSAYHPQAPVQLECTYGDRGRPGLITAIGVLSIVIGSLGILASGWGVVSGLIAVSFTSSTVMAVEETTAAGTLTAEQADAIVDALHARQPMDAATQQLLAKALQEAEMPFAPPDEGQAWSAGMVDAQIEGTSTTPAGEQVFDFPGGILTAGPSRVESDLYAGSFDTLTVTSTGVTGATPPMPNFADSSVPTAATVLGMVGEILSLGLAVVLLTAGILTLRNSPRSPSLHRRWAFAKIVLTLLGTTVGIWTMWSMFGEGGAFSDFGSGPAFGTGFWIVLMIFFALFGLLLGCAYPVAVLIVFRLERVKAYYREIGAA